MTDDLSAYTEPALLVADGDDLRVRAANDRMREWVGIDPAGQSLSTVTDRCFSPGASSVLVESIERGERIDRTVHAGDGPYLPRVVRQTDEGRHLLFVPLPETLDRANQSEAVAHVVSHDLRNPLDVASAHLEASRDERDDDHLAAVARAHDRMEEIIHDVLTLARGEQAISPTDGVDVGTVVADAHERLTTDGIELVIDESLPVVTADRPRVKRLVENLLRNAVDHAGRDATVYAGALSDGFYVADDGDGVTADARDRVFEPGYATGDDGTGLGLAIVRRIANAHGWSVRFTESRFGGARVEIRFDAGGDATRRAVNDPVGARDTAESSDVVGAHDAARPSDETSQGGDL